jgi:hypothetical protein
MRVDYATFVAQVSLDPAMKPITFNEMMHWAMWNVCDRARLGNPSPRPSSSISPCFESHSIPAWIQLVSVVRVLYSDCTP